MDAAQVQVLFHLHGIATKRDAEKLIDLWLQSAEDDDRLTSYEVEEFTATDSHSRRIK